MLEYFINNLDQKTAAPTMGRAVEVSMLKEKFGPSRWGRVAAQVVAFTACALVSASGAVDLSRSEALRIGKLIWQNECAGTVEGLTSWNSGENFASLGIGHFIWYPQGVRGPFAESFPDLLRFMEKRGTELPPVAAQNRSGCPWNTRAEFLAAQSGAEMRELRRFLAGTVDLQAQFLVQRLQSALPKMLAEAPAGDRAKIEERFNRVASTAQGCYALVDYVNFKGEGVARSERYEGRGWGLLQVLEGMTDTSGGAAAAREFSASARRVLTQRVQNSPPARREARWLDGWVKRVNTYAAN